MAPRSVEEGGVGLSCWFRTRRACIVVGGAAVLSSVVYVLYRYYRSRRDSDLSKDEGFEDTTKVCMMIGSRILSLFCKQSHVNVEKSYVKSFPPFPYTFPFFPLSFPLFSIFLHCGVDMQSLICTHDWLSV